MLDRVTLVECELEDERWRFIAVSGDFYQAQSLHSAVM